MALATLTVDLIAKVGGFESDMGRASKTAKKRMGEIEAAAKKMGVAVGIALAAGATALGGAIKGAIDRADELYNTAKKIGVTTESLSGLEYAASMAGVELDALQGSLGKMTKLQVEAAGGSKDAAHLFAQMGVEIRDANGQLRGTELVLADLAGVFASMPDGPGKTALAMKVFGKSGADLIPLLNDGKKGLKEFADRARELGLVVTDVAGKQADDFNDKIDEIKWAVKGAAWQIAEDLMPDLKALATRFEEVTGAGNGTGSMAHFIANQLRTLTDQIESFLYQTAALKKLYAEQGWFGDGIIKTTDDAAKRIKEIQDRRHAGEGSSIARHAPDRPMHTPFPLDGQIYIPADPSQFGIDAGKSARTGGGHAAEDARRQLEEAREAAIQFHDALQDMRDELAGPLDQALTEHNRKLAELEDLATKGKISEEERKQAAQEETALYAKRVEAIKSLKTPLEEVIDAQKRELALLGLTGAALQTASDLYGATAEDAKKYGAQIRENNETMAAAREHVAVADQFRDHWQDAFAGILDGSKSVKEAFDDLASSILSDIARMVARNWVEELFGPYGTQGGGSAGGILDALFGGGSSKAGGDPSSLFKLGFGASKFAEGTDFAPGGWALVGERGPEIVRMPRGAQVIPNHEMRQGGKGGMILNQVINVPRGTDYKTAEQIANAAARAMTRANARK